MAHCNPTGRYQNYFLTVPDRGFSKEALVSFIDSWRSDYAYLEVCREPYSTPKAGFTHHYHAGLCFHNKVGFLKFVKASNKSKHFTGMDFRQPLVAKNASAREIFHKYFTNPSKYKALDEHPMLVRDAPPEPKPTFYGAATCPPNMIPQFTEWLTWYHMYGPKNYRTTSQLW